MNTSEDTQINTTNTTITLDYILILDFEATCDNTKRPKPQEIIEFPSLLYNVETREIEDVFHFYIKPDVHPNLTQFCTDLTGITQEQIDNDGISLKDALYRHEIWLQEKRLIPLHDFHDEDGSSQDGMHSMHSFLYLTCGDWDLATCLPRQLKHSNDKTPNHFKKWLNVKKEFTKLYGTKARGMAEMLGLLGLELEGRHHSGIDDCHNIAKICTKMLEDGWRPKSF